MELFKKIKSAMGLKTEESIGKNTEENTEFREAIDRCIREYTSQTHFFFYNVTFSEIPFYNESIKKWDDEKKGEFAIYLANTSKNTYPSYRKGHQKLHDEHQLTSQMLANMFRSKMKFSEKNIVALYEIFKQKFCNETYTGIYWWPIAGFFRQIEYSFPPTEIPESVVGLLNEIVSIEKSPNTYFYKEQVKLDEKIKIYLHAAKGEEGGVKPTYFLGEDEFQPFANNVLEQQKEEDKKLWFELIALAQKANGGKPSQKYLNEAKKIIDQLGSDKFKKVTQEWFTFVINLKETVTVKTYTYSGYESTYNVIEFLSSLNADAIKGFVWMSSWFYDNTTIQTISKLADRSFKKIPEKGPAAAGIGNACLYTLYASKGLDGIAQLSRLRLKIKQANTLTLIEKYIDEAAAKLGISSTEIEDLAVDDFKLKDHQLTYTFDDFTGVLELTGIGKSNLKWIKPDGSQQKSVPQLVKDKFAAKLKKLKAVQKQIDQTTVSQKERFDRMLRSNRTMTLDYFKEKYIQHGLLSFVINKVIFKFSNDTTECLAIYSNNQWISIHHDPIGIDEFTTVSLWHPVTSSTNEVKEWRQFLLEGQIQQPFKQAYREIYLLTEAEINTRTYSNRMASHILKQHQYVTLAKGRNWKAKLMGAWDGGDEDTALLFLPEYAIRVEYWVNPLNANDEFNATGIWNYVTTDQIRFVNSETNELIELINVPPIAFSEAMRDVDLFVGVASVGNDPTWSDSGGLPNHRDYWQSYSFGDLSEIAKNRKEILQGLIPRLKIASVTHIEDRFVVVKGKLRTYKIHIGSTNILMEPNDQYLCIVPDRSKKDVSENLFLPFEGDNGLSVIISKAFLLAADDKITDSSITSQINR
ncbi:DUF4132 domain-containing protein [Flavobacterium amniphilum]|uniref:DUF4132 domain-containing protein n=1 Tax=Flavobacterium amniphilum TaxID=1834035 RepID=UPI00202AC1D7|nr:DUF4132 domain-containing protein [Flavobacterium amniphilum]MCL9807027.1 DUF4132 domain-containing protein [Flavobacterium amniphilum]